MTGSSRSSPSPASRPEQAAEAREVFAVIARLSEPFRDAIVAVDMAGLSYAEAAELLGYQGGDHHLEAVQGAGAGRSRDGIVPGERRNG